MLLDLELIATFICPNRRAGEFRFAYSDLFTVRGELIAQVGSYIVPLR